MSEDTKYYNDEQFERLVRSYDRRKDRGVAGLISRIFYFREAHKYLEPERFERFCERNYIRSNIWDTCMGAGRTIEMTSASRRPLIQNRTA